MSSFTRVSTRPAFDLSLYLVANRPSYPDQALFFSKIQSAVRGGVTCVQLRDHENDYSQVLDTACRLRRLLSGVSFFINTHNPLGIAKAACADGVFLENPLSYSQARKELGEKTIIGIPIRSVGALRKIETSTEIDYISIKIAPSKRTCPNNEHLLGIKGLRSIRRDSSYRIVGIGGLDLDTVESVYRELLPGDGVAMAGGLMEKDQPLLTAQKILAIRKHILETR